MRQHGPYLPTGKPSFSPPEEREASPSRLSPLAHFSGRTGDLPAKSELAGGSERYRRPYLILVGLKGRTPLEQCPCRSTAPVAPPWVLTLNSYLKVAIFLPPLYGDPRSGIRYCRSCRGGKFADCVTGLPALSRESTGRRGMLCGKFFACTWCGDQALRRDRDAESSAFLATPRRGALLMGYGHCEFICFGATHVNSHLTFIGAELRFSDNLYHRCARTHQNSHHYDRDDRRRPAMQGGAATSVPCLGMPNFVPVALRRRRA